MAEELEATKRTMAEELKATWEDLGKLTDQCQQEIDDLEGDKQ